MGQFKACLTDPLGRRPEAAQQGGAIPGQRAIPRGYPGTLAIADYPRAVGVRMGGVCKESVARVLRDRKMLPVECQDSFACMGMQPLRVSACRRTQLNLMGIGLQVAVPQAGFAAGSDRRE